MWPNNKRKEGFSYTSSSIERKNATKFLAIEIAATVVAMIIILLLLVYLKVIKIGNIGNSFTPSAKIKTQHESSRGGPGIDENGNYDPNKVGFINSNDDIKEASLSAVSFLTTSAISGKKFAITNTQKLQSLMNQFGLINKVTISTASNTPLIRFKFDTLTLNLTNIPQKTNIYAGNEAQPLYSSSVEPKGKTLVMNLYLSPKALSGEDASVYAEKVLVTTLFRWGYNPEGMFINPQKEKELDSLLIELEKSSDRFLSVQ